MSACVLSAGTLSACQAFDASKLDSLLSPIDTPPQDAGGRDTGVDQPCTTFKAEVCNDLDDDCDDKVDESADESCFQPQSSSVCSDEGRCIVVGCDTGYVDCNEIDGDGCEHAAADGPCPNECDEMCLDAGHDSGRDSGPDEPEDAAVEDAGEDAAVDVPDACVAQPEACDDLDNDCDDKVDETAECAIERCVATVPSYRGAGCDRCVCEKCGAQRAECQEHPNATWREQCRDVLECYVVQARAGNCQGADCYVTGACAAEINIAAGGVDGDDASGALAGNCTWVNPPTHACMGATRYRDQCTLDLCEAECAD